ncbi:MAG: ATP-binding cassette domain-containing protein [Acholeplasmataceae bacterium]|nr:MAG: ATP-binding cassette domain-containing protein [Acholeplasmataceae bacterium]
MLRLKNISKSYDLGTRVVDALKGINLAFREQEFVAILGQSGSGKTTLLNVIGGLDRYSDGDLEIDRVSTKRYKDADWDTYRNHRVGFVFQNYNLIAHISVLQNVELALTISGVGPKERRNRATKVLEQVGLADQLDKKPNQLSGGQMQRVAIARALVNDPNIILADEPTGALDSKTSIQIMDILKSISKDKLIILVTHNPLLAETYSDRIIKLLDGEVIADSKPHASQDELSMKEKRKQTAMSFSTALKLSFNNLFTKKIRTIITAVAGSIGIIGVALVLSLSNGFGRYVNNVQTDLLASLPITIDRTTTVLPTNVLNFGQTRMPDREGLFPETDFVTPLVPTSNINVYTHANIMTQDYIDYIQALDSNLYDDITMTYSVSPVFLRMRPDETVHHISNSAFRINELAADNPEYLLTQYDILAGEFPEPDSFDAVIVVNSRNQLLDSMLNALGFPGQNIEVPFEDLLGMTFKLVNNDIYYVKNEDTGLYQPRLSAYHDEAAIEVRVVGILRVKEDAASSILSMGIGYTSLLTRYVLDTARDSQVVQAQLEAFTTGEDTGTYVNVINGNPITRAETLSRLTSLGAPQFPNRITIYPKSFEAKDAITTYLRDYNDRFDQELERHLFIIHTDVSETVTGVLGQMIRTITIILVAFAAISLFVSSLMIGIITYVSVIERTKEIGVLRSIGARKIDITRVFNAETMIIGFTAGTFGVLATYAMNPLINIVLHGITGARGIASLNVLPAFLLIMVSVALTLIAGLIPATIASKKDPVVALRTE